jgi:hypothetical protein
MAKSPSITLIEKDASSYPITTSATVLAVLGYASTGPIDEPKMLTSRNEFIEIFGTPPEDSPYSHLAVYRAFNQGNQVVFLRVAESTGDSQAFASERVINDAGGDSNHVKFVSKYKGSYNDNLKVIVKMVDNPVGDTMWDMFVYSGTELKESFSNISWISGDSDFFETKVNAAVDNDGSSLVIVDTWSPGGDSDFQIDADSYWIGKAQGGDTNPWNDGDTWTGDTADEFYNYRPGADGVPTGDSRSSTLHVAQLGTNDLIANAEEWDYHILITPDNSTQNTQDTAITLAEFRADFVYIADPPYSLTSSQAVTWHNGGGNGRTTAINSSYAATYWPWLKDYNVDSGQYVWCPPSVFIAEKYLEVDRNFAPWYAPAGDARGMITAYDYEASPSFSEREALYGDLNAVNPIVNFTNKGLEIYGQKTLLRANSALNRVAVRRMVVYVKKLIKSAMDSIVFEPHTPDSWTRATNICNAILEPVRQGGGLDDYRVVIDSTTNTPDMIAQSIMKGIIKLVPVGTIEIIELSIQIYSPGATITG